jgi:UDP-N-acetyl-2-amino-2-deoxyglucuronate dehydrogenase
MTEGKTPKTFGILGVGGYIAPRHLQAIQENGCRLVAACDPKDSVGIIDRYFRDAYFFTEIERFDRHLEKLRRRNEGIDYLSICSPNYLHDAHARLALRLGADAICEKPLVINPWNLDALEEIESEFQKKIYNILQLRLHPTIQNLRKEILEQDSKERHKVELTYITSRGRWYGTSWKGDESRSGGVVTNIGIHFFDMLTWIFGKNVESQVHQYEPNKASGWLQLENADVSWYLSIDHSDLPDTCKEKGQTTFRSIMVDGGEMEFSTGFTDLHTASYRDILSGGGFGIKDARTSIEIVHQIRNAAVKTPDERAHPFVKP